MKKLLFILFICLFFSSAYTQEKFMLFADYALFRYADNKSTVEMYFSANQRDLKYNLVNGEFTGQLNVEINIFDKSKNKVVFDDIFGLISKVSDTSKSKLNNKLIGQQNFTLPVSDYVIKLIGSDFNNRAKCDTITFNFQLASYDSLKTILSDIQLSTSYVKSNDNKSIFYKNGFEITPNPDALYGMNLKTLYYYFEVYSLKKDFRNDNIYVVFSVTDLSNNIVKQFIKPEKSRADAFFEIGQIDIDSLDKGVYLLKAKMLDSTSGFSVEREKKFFVYNKSKNISNESSDEKGFLTSEYKTLSQENVDDEYDKSLYIRSTPETEEYAKLKTLDEKRKFLFNFWRKRKTNLNSPVNDYKVDYFKRINDANKYYKQGFMDGWKTDKGRIYIIYGRPSEIDNHPNEADSKAYEIWSFNNIQSNAVCVFAEDEIGGGIFHLVHSTIRGEFSDTDWKTKLKK
jgi:GWxTD domain-containing protein